MREHFEDRKLTGAINVACKYDDGTIRYWRTMKEEVVEHIKDIVEEYRQDGYILTLRQLHYQFVTNNWIVNHDTAYKKLGSILDDCRYAGIIDWDAIEDRGRVPYLPYWVHDVEHALNDTIEQYRIDRQDGQKNHIELYTEKDALSGILRRSTEKYHIQLCVNKGYTSSSAIYSAYRRYAKIVKEERNVVVLYFGDHDPSGLDMVRDIHSRLFLFFSKGNYAERLNMDLLHDFLQIIPIGLTMEQIKKYKLPPNPTKITDSRAKKYIEKFGRTCWEVDALKPQVLTSIVEKNIEEHMDMPLFKEKLKEEAKGLAELKGFINTRNKK